MGIYCAAPSCKNNSRKKPELSFYRFPKDKERCKHWVINTRRLDLFKKSPNHLYNNFRLCAKHFEPSKIVASKKLVFNAVPTLFDVPNSPPRITLKRKLPEKQDLKTHAAMAIDELKSHHTYACSVGYVSLPSAIQATQGRIIPDNCSSTHASFNSELVQKDTSVPSGQNLCIPVRRHQAEVEALQNKLKNERVRSSRLRRKVALLQTKLNEARRYNVDSVGGIIEHARNYLSGLSLQLFSSQLRIANRNVHGRRYTAEDFDLAIKLRSLGPKAYKALSQIFSLPTKQSLRRVSGLGAANSGERVTRTEEQTTQSGEQTTRSEEQVNGLDEELGRLEEQMSRSEDQRGLGMKMGRSEDQMCQSEDQVCQSEEQMGQMEGQVAWNDGNEENDFLLLAIAQSGLSI